jgi:pyruvate/2-oxoglutarate dehydrogenase complex dihydrolipoamide dehydrogenase (E3) component
MLSELSLALKLQVPIDVLADLIHPFPTFSRALNSAFKELRARLH